MPKAPIIHQPGRAERMAAREAAEAEAKKKPARRAGSRRKRK